MTRSRAIPELGHVDDEALERLALTWRAQALRGDREAYGIAHALEVERRRRLRASQMAVLPPEPKRPPKRWWQFWKGSSATASGSNGDSEEPSWPA